MIVVATIVYIGVETWLMLTADWPAQCLPGGHPNIVDFGRMYLCSPSLLHDGIQGVATFVWMWLLPAGIAGFVTFARLRRSRDQ